MNVRELIIENVSRNPANIAAALRLTATQTGKSYAACNQMYYRDIRHNEPLFVFKSKYGYVSNVKTSPVLRVGKKTLKLKYSVQSLGKLTTQQKADYFDLLIG